MDAPHEQLPLPVHVCTVSSMAMLVGCDHSLPSLFLLFPLQCKVLAEGVELHARVRPESMKALHERMEELLQDYSTRYGNRTSIVSASDYEKYDVAMYQPIEGQVVPRRMSSSRRRESQKKLSGMCRGGGAEVVSALAQ